MRCFHVLSALALSAVLGASLGCSLRVGSRGGGDNGNSAQDGGVAAGDDAGPPPPVPSACERVGTEVKVSTPIGTDTFALKWDGDHYVIVYADKSTGNGDIYTLLLNADGSPRGAAIPVELTPATSDLPNIVVTPSGYLVAWQEGTAGKAVYARALDKAGNPTGDGVTIASTQSDQARPVVTGAPGGFAVAWMDNILGAPAVQIGTIDSAMHVKGPTRIATGSGGAGWPWIAGDDTGVGMIWSDHGKGQFDIHFADVDPAALAPQNEEAIRSGVPKDALLGRMIRTSFGYLAAWEDLRGDDNQIFMALLDPTGKKFADGLVEEPNTGDANWPNMSWTGSSAGVVYYQWRDNNAQIFMSFIDGTGKRVGPQHDLQVSSAPPGSDAKFPDVAWTGSEFGVAWVDTRGGRPDLYFTRVACKGPGPA